MASKVRCMNFADFCAQWETLVLAKPGLACYVQTHKGVAGLSMDRMNGWKLTKCDYNELRKPGQSMDNITVLGEGKINYL